MASAPVAAGHLNPGVIEGLTRGPQPLARIVRLPSPFKSTRGQLVDHLQITDAGRRCLRGES